ncbi:MAG: hypothetical protein KKI02_02110 [Planctomycetes bacterium]|nr:hypothetical protein [Planctomycetota bacterium]
MHQRMKYCSLRVHVASGAIISGRFHIMEETSPAVRPFDAVRDARGGVLLLTNASVSEDGDSSEHDAVMVNQRAIAYVVLPTEDWIEEEKNGEQENAGTF